MRIKVIMCLVAVMMAVFAMTGCVSPTPQVTTQITSEPSGAAITLDGKLLGTTPLTAKINKKPDYSGPSTFRGTARNMRDALQQMERQKQKANYIFKAHKDGYVDARKEIFVNDGIPSDLRFELQAIEAPKQK